MADKTYRLTFSFSDGTSKSVDFTVPAGERGEKGEKGDPYVLTDADRQALVTGVLAALPVGEEASF
jgi:hypothetical protein